MNPAWAPLAALAILSFALGLVLYRLVKGPDVLDRVLAYDLAGIVSLAFALAAAAWTGKAVFLEVAVVLAALGFLGTVAFAGYYIQRKGGADAERRDPTPEPADRSGGGKAPVLLWAGSVGVAVGEVLLLGGALVVLLAAWGLVRMPDFYMRMHAGTKASSLGVIIMALAVAILVDQPGVWSRTLVVAFFVAFTTPLASHLLARSAHRHGIARWRGTTHDALEMSERGIARQPEADLDQEDQGVRKSG